MSASPGWEELFARRAVGVRLGVETVRAVFEGLGAPAGSVPAIHVVGTNGKGSTAALAAHALTGVGRRTGLFTSPHLHRVGERVRIDGQPVPDGDLLEAVRRVVQAEAGHDLPRPLSFFELLTLAAMRVFGDAGVDVVVAECGLGGRLDATRIVSARVVAVARIGLDHQAYLGPTVSAIAHEKAGAFVPGVPVLTVRQPREARAVLWREAARVGASVTEVAPLNAAPAGLTGAHQRANAGLALAAARHLDPRVGPEHLAGVRWPGRLEIIRVGRGTVVLDVAHNLDGVQALARHLGTDPDVVVLGTLADKPAAALVRRLAAVAPVWWVPPPGESAAPPAGVARAHASVDAPRFRADWDEALARGQVLCVCGSHHLVGVLRARLLGQEEPPDPGDPLHRSG